MVIYTDQGKPEEIIQRIPSEWRVLDIGGHDRVLPRANVVIDIQPYESRRQFYHGQECFSKDNWIIMDFGGSQDYQLPFLDKSFDFVWCQQTLEDIADPFKLMREMQRVGKGGFIEVPNREWEHAPGVDSPGFSGFCHHRWCCELEAPREYGEIIFVFTMKSPYIFQYGACELPEKKNLGFVWADTIEFRENLLLTKEIIIQDVIDFKNIRRKNQIGVY